MPTVEAVKAAKPPVHVDENKLLEKNLAQEEFAYARMSATLPVGWTVEDALRPEFWANVAHRFRADATTGRRDFTGSIIVLRAQDHSFYAELYVRAVQERGLLVSLMREPIYFGPREVDIGTRFEMRWNVGKRGYDIIRQSDREIVADGATLPTKEQAVEWIRKTSAS